MNYFIYGGVSACALLSSYIWYDKITFVYEFLCLKIKLKILEYLEVGQLKHLSGNIYEVGYISGSSKYKFIFEKKRGPSRYSKVFDENDKDITKQIKEYAGPGHNFHGVNIEPSFLGKRSISFHMKKGDIKTYRGNDKVIEI